MSNMFHTFETQQYTTPSQQEVNATAAAKRRTSTVRACEPCRRRKIRCNGEHPCETCQWYRKASSCHYTEPRQRQVPSRRSVEKISQTLQEYRGILQRLFPNIHPEQLVGLSREKLVDLLSKTGPLQAPSPLSPGHDVKQEGSQSDDSSLEQLQPQPDDVEDDYDAASRQRTLTGISDDVNALSLTGKESPSYLGISSVMAVLRVILWLDPDCQTFVNRTTAPEAVYSPGSASSLSILEPPSSTTPTGEPKPSQWDEPFIIDAYFHYVHPSTPLIDEQSFRDAYMSKKRSDSRWQLLLNAVLAVGAIAASTDAASNTHSYYFSLAREQLTVDALGAVHIETVQALALLSGYYLHHIQEPNLANSIMGATLRLATALGLHRDFSEGLGGTKDATTTQKATSSIEMRRRVWWSTFMLDTWVGSILGRPSMGRMSAAVTAQQPSLPIDGSDTQLKLAQENIRFCQISTRMEDNLATSPLMEDGERQSLDAAFVEWYQSSSVQSSATIATDTTQYHTPLSATSPDDPGLTLTKSLMRWRYHLARITLHRPTLLWAAMRTRRPSSHNTLVLSNTRTATIALTRSITADLITDIAANWTTPSFPPTTFSASQATSLLYQAVMVPLLSLFSHSRDPATTTEARQLVELSIAALSEMQAHARTAKRSLEVVSAIYNASRRHSPEHTYRDLPSMNLLHHQQHSDTDQDLLMSTTNLDVFATHASSSVSGSVTADTNIPSGGLGTPATLPSSVSTSSHQHPHSHSHHLLSAQQRPSFIDLPPLSVGGFTSAGPHPFTHHTSGSNNNPHHAHLHGQDLSGTYLTTPTPTYLSSAATESTTTNLLDSLNWSQGWSDTNYPFETPRLGWDYQAMNGWVGGVGGGGVDGMCGGEVGGYFADGGIGMERDVSLQGRGAGGGDEEWRV